MGFYHRVIAKGTFGSTAFVGNIKYLSQGSFGDLHCMILALEGEEK